MNDTYSDNEIQIYTISYQDINTIKSSIEVNTAINSLILGVLIAFICVKVVLK